MIVVIGAFVFGPTKAMYAIVAIYIVGKVTDGLQEGLNYAKSSIYYYGSSGRGIEKNSRRSGPWGDRCSCTGMYAGTER